MLYDLEYVNGIPVSVKININCIKQIRTLIVAMLIKNRNIIILSSQTCI